MNPNEPPSRVPEEIALRAENRTEAPPPEPPTTTARNDEPASFGERLRVLRLRTGLSQKQLARSSTLSIRAIRDLENGRVRQPRSETLRLLADGLGVGTGELSRPADGAPPGSSGPPGPPVIAGAPGAPGSPVIAGPPVSGPFVGRERELEALTTMLRTEQHRLVTIVGIEGVGKTRLALAVARALQAAERSAVLWLPLDGGPLRSGWAPVGAPQRQAWPYDAVRPGTDRRRLVEAVGDSDGLLVLDGARPEDRPADVAADLLAACPRLRIVVTTRTPAGLPIDTLFPLPPLPLPEPGTPPSETERVASVTLLLAQIKRIQPAFRSDERIVAEAARICHALDGIPAALEAVAHWSLIYSLRQLADQLTSEPLVFVRRPRGGQRRDAFTSLRDILGGLSDRQCDLLASMSGGTFRGRRDHWSLAEMAAEVGLPVADCADDVYHLLVLGLLRRVEDRDVARFGLLNIVRTVGMDAVGAGPDPDAATDPDATHPAATHPAAPDPDAVTCSGGCPNR